MKKNGFTLIELLGVIIVLGMIALVIFPSISKSIRNSKQKIYDEQVTLLENNARRWGIEHTNLLPDSGAYYLELEELVNGGYVAKGDIKDPRTEKVMGGCIVIGYDDEHSQYQYEYVETTCADSRPTTLTIAEKVSNSIETLKEDPSSSVRYVGTNPNNYVEFNGELWRIIGIFGGKAKIIKNDFYQSGSTKAWSTIEKNDWTTSTLMQELNGSYLDSISSDSKGYIDLTHSWNLGGPGSSYEESGTRIHFYTNENKIDVVDGRPTSWEGAIGLLHVSDYGYATGERDDACKNIPMTKWTGTATLESCKSNDWLLSNVEQLTLTSNNEEVNTVYSISATGIVQKNNVTTVGAVRPVLYLKSNVKIASGEGTETKPFKLTL